MDPVEALKNARKAAKALRRALELAPAPFDAQSDVMDRAEELLESWEALDGWLSKGGFSPWLSQRSGT